MIRVQVPKARIHPAGKHDGPPRLELRTHDRRVAWTHARRTYQRLDHRATLDLVVVLANNPVLAGHRRMGQYSLEQIFARGPIHRPEFARLLRLGLINGLPNHRRPAGMQKLHRQRTDLGLLVHQTKVSRRYEFADDSKFDILVLTEFLEACQMDRRDGQNHPFLGFADPNFGVAEPLVFHRGAIEPNFGSQLLAHFADGAAKAACPAVGHRVVQAFIARLKEHIEDHLLGDRISDLNRSARYRFALAGQLHRTERRTVDPVATGSPTDGHDPITRLGLLVDLVDGQ